jgi:hypothetical protein
MATCLPTLINLESLILEFQYGQSYPGINSRRPFPPTHSVLPNLKKFQFKGVIEYFEVFVAGITAPQLYRLSITFFNDIGTPELNQLISRTPSFGTCDEARFIFDSRRVLFRLCQSHPEPRPSDRGIVEVDIFSDRQLSTLAQICILSLRPLLTIENLYIHEVQYSWLITWKDQDDFENTEWLDLLLPFTAVKNLYVSELFAPRIAPALQDITRGEVLSNLQNLYLEGFKRNSYLERFPLVEEGIERFISARQLTNHPVAISLWDRIKGKSLWTFWG